MKTPFIAPRGMRNERRSERGSILLVTLIFAIAIGISLFSYVQLSNNSLKLAQRTFFANACNNLAEAGTEEAVWSFNKMGNSTNPTTVAGAWTGWSLGNSVADVYMDTVGSGYTSAPTVTFSGGGGTGAAGTALLTTYEEIDRSTGSVTTVTRVTGVTITNAGSGYTTAPLVTLTGGGGSGAVARARLAATRTFTFGNLDQQGTGTVKVWVAGYDGSAVVPIVVSKATITTPVESAPIEKTIKIILSKNGVLPKGVVAKNGVNWNGIPLANSYISSLVAGQPPFSAYDSGTARANTTVASLNGTIDLANGALMGNLMYGPGVSLSVNRASVTGDTIGNFSYDFTMPTYPINSGSSAGVDLGGVVPASLPRAADLSARAVKVAAGLATDADPYYYYVHNAEIGSTTITAGTNVIIVGDSNTRLRTGFNVPSSGAAPWKAGSAKIYMDGDINLSGNDSINVIASPNTSWAGALEVYTTTAGDLSFSGNGDFVGCIFAPNARLVGNGGGSSRTDLCGSFVVGSITDNGHMYFHFDEGLGSTPNPKAWGLALWTELQTAEDRAAYASKLNF